jgi:hypothetical protein
VLGEMGTPKDSPAGRRQFELRMEQRRREQGKTDWWKLRRGWCFGGETFREELLVQARDKFGADHYGRQRQEGAEQKAKRIVEEELKSLGWKSGELRRLLKGDLARLPNGLGSPQKVGGLDSAGNFDREFGTRVHRASFKSAILVASVEHS